MEKENASYEETSFWECLHDGKMKAMQHNALSRVATLTWDVPYLWEFHGLHANTRFIIQLDEVTEMQVLNFLPWPGSQDFPIGLSRTEQEIIRRGYQKKSVYTSGDWSSFVESVKASEYECSNASLTTISEGSLIFSCNLSDSVNYKYPTIRFIFSNMHIALSSGRDLTPVAFLAMGAAYWNDFAERSAKL